MKSKPKEMSSADARPGAAAGLTQRMLTQRISSLLMFLERSLLGLGWLDGPEAGQRGSSAILTLAKPSSYGESIRRSTLTLSNRQASSSRR